MSPPVRRRVATLGAYAAHTAQRRQAHARVRHAHMSSPESDPSAASMGGGEFAVPSFLRPTGYTESDRAEISRHLAEAGASEQEIAEAARTGTLGVLALDLALRPPGEMVSLADAAATVPMPALFFLPPVSALTPCPPRHRFIRRLALFARVRNRFVAPRAHGAETSAQCGGHVFHQPLGRYHQQVAERTMPISWGFCRLVPGVANTCT